MRARVWATRADATFLEGHAEAFCTKRALDLMFEFSKLC